MYSVNLIQTLTLLFFVSVFSGSRVPGQSISFAMTRNECLKRTIIDSNPYQFIGHLNLNGELVGCPESNGILSRGRRSSIPAIYSNRTITSFSKSIGHSNISIEIWFRSMLNFDGDTVLFSILHPGGTVYRS